MKAVFSPLVVGTLIAAAFNSVIYLVAKELLGEPFQIDPDGQGGNAETSIPAFTPAVFTVFLAIVGGVAVAAIAMATKRPRRSWRVVTLIGLALSFVPTAFAAMGNGSTFLWLASMHVAAGALVIPLVERALPETKEAPVDDSPGDSESPGVNE